MNNRATRSLRFVAATTALIIFLCCLAALGFMAEPVVIHYRLCNELGIPFYGSQCRKTSIPGLLEMSFTPGITTRNEVNTTLGKYHTFSAPRPAGGIMETYTFDRSIFGSTSAGFQFDESDVLIFFDYLD